MVAARDEGAFPPRSLVAAITGAASGVLTAAMSAFRPRTRTDFALDLGVAEPRALLLVAVDPLLRRVDVDEGQHIGPREQRRQGREPGQQFPAGFSSCSTFPQA
jgi:hypothetical protein